jgi:uncharacterized protein (TIGR00304 family)
MRDGSHIIFAGAILSVIGLLVFMTGLVANSLILGNDGSASFGGVIMIGPIPLIFGTDRTALLIAVFGAVILMIAASAIIYVGARKSIPSREDV